MAGAEGAAVAGLRQDVVAGIAVACVSLPICLATGLLLFNPLGSAYYAAGIAASLYGFIVGGTAAALAGRSSFLVSSPRASTALVQASLLGSVAAGASVLQEPLAVLAATALCVLLAGLWQLLFSALRLAQVIKFTPHPVLAGFINGVALLIIVSQLRPVIDRPLRLGFVLVVAAFVIAFGRWSRRVPGGLAGLVVGVTLFHGIGRLYPGADLGPLLGPFALPLPPRPPLADLFDASVRKAIEPLAGQVVLTSLALAVVATLESLLSFRAAQNLSANAVNPVRDLVAQAAGNCASAVAGGMAITASPLQSTAAYRGGGRTRAVALTAVSLVGALVVAAPSLLAAVPVVVLSALLVATGGLLFDRWSLRQLGEALRGAPSRRRRILSDLAIVLLVMLLTAGVSVLAGILAGSLLAALIFVMNMSRPVVRRQHSGDRLVSKRVRPAGDATLLRRNGGRRRALELEGVLFFGNADDLSRTVRGLFDTCDTLALDLRGVSDIDATGEQILRTMVSASRAAGKTLVFCNAPPAHRELVESLAAGAPAPFPDLDAALEWMEERELLAHAAERSAGHGLSLWQHPLLQGLDAADREALAPRLLQRRLPAGGTLCAEGEPAGAVWFLTRGSASVRVATPDGGSLRVSSCAPGTAVGEMALLQFGTRSASVVADEDLEAHELSRESFEWLSSNRPEAAAKLLRNMATELAQRLRERTADLRHALT